MHERRATIENWRGKELPAIENTLHIQAASTRMGKILLGRDGDRIQPAGNSKETEKGINVFRKWKIIKGSRFFGYRLDAGRSIRKIFWSDLTKWIKKKKEIKNNLKSELNSVDDMESLKCIE